MKNTWKRALSALLTIAMLASLLIVPASAGKAVVDGKNVYTLEFGTDVTATVGESNNFASAVEGYFSLRTAGYATSGNDVGTKMTDGYTPLAAAKLNCAKTTEGAKGDKYHIDFTAKSDNPTVTVWWYGLTHSKLVIGKANSNALDDQLDGTVVTENGAFKSSVTLTASAGDKIVIGAWKPESGDNANLHIYKVEVTDGEAKNATAVEIDDKNTTTLAVGDELQLSASVTPSDSTDEPKWATSDEDVATVDQTGKVTGVADGTVTITVTAGSFSDTIGLTVGTGTKHTHGENWTEDETTRQEPTCAKPGLVIEKCDNDRENCPGREKVLEATKVHSYSEETGLCTVCKAVDPSWPDVAICIWASANAAGKPGTDLSGAAQTFFTNSSSSNPKDRATSPQTYCDKDLTVTVYLDNGGKLEMTAPKAGTLVLYMGGATDKVTVTPVGGEASTPTAVDHVLTCDVAAGKIEITKANSSVDVYLAAFLPEKDAEEGGNVAAEAVETVLAAIGDGATAEAANFEASKGDLDTSDEEALNRFVVDALMAKMGAYAQQVEFEVNKAVYTPNEATASLLAAGEVKVGEIAYEVTVFAKGSTSDTADIAGTIDVMAAEGGDEPDPPTPAKTEWDFTTSFENGEGVEYDGLTLNKINYHNSLLARFGSDGSIVVPVSGECDVEVTYNYGANATVGVEGGAAIWTNNGMGIGSATFPKATYHYAGSEAGNVVIAGVDGTTYVEKIKIVTPATATATKALEVAPLTDVAVEVGAESDPIYAFVQYGTSTDAITVASGDTSVATVSELANKQFKITGAAEGETTVTVSGNGETKSIKVTVTDSTPAVPLAAGTYRLINKNAEAASNEKNKAITFVGDGWSKTSVNDHGVLNSAAATIDLLLAKPEGDKVIKLTVETCYYNSHGGAVTANKGTAGDTTAIEASVMGKNDSQTVDGKAVAAYQTVISNIELTEAGTVTLNIPANTYVHGFTVEHVEKAAPVDKTELNAALAAAKAIDTTGVEVSADGSDVLVDKQWVTQAVKDALTSAISNGETIAAKAAATEDEVTAATTALTAATTGWQPAAGTKLKTMSVSADDVSTVYDGSAKTIEVKGAPAGATITYCATAGGSFVADQPEMKNASDTPYTVYYKVTAAGYETATGSATITITKKAAPTNITLKADTAEIEAEGGTVTFTLTNIPADASVAPVGKCSEKVGETFTFVKQADGTYKGENVVAASTEGARTHNVTVTWEDPNYTKVEKTMTLSQLAQGAIKATPATGLAPWAGVDYAALGATAAVSGQMVTLTIDEAKILAAYAADPDTFQGGSMNHGGNAYMMIQFEAPTDVTTSWTVKQTVNGGAESGEWKLDGTGGDLDCWTADGKLMIGDWFGILTGVTGTTQGMPEVNTYVMRYNFYDEGEMKAAVTYTVDRHVVKAATVTLVANADLADVTVPAKISPEENFELTVAVKDAATKVLPNTITVKKNNTAMAAGDYTWDPATGKLTIAAAKLAPEDAIEITVAPVNKAADKTALTAAITAATEKKTGVETSADGKDIAKDKTWVTTAVMDALNEKLTAAQTVAANAAATQAEVDAAKDALVAATTAFAPAAGLKDEGGEPTEAVVATKGTYTMEAGELFAATADDASWRSAEPLSNNANRYEITQDAAKVVDRVFTVYAKTDASGTTPGYMEADAKTYDDGYVTTHNISFGDKIKFMGDDLTPNAVIGFTTDAPATLKVWWRGGGTGGRTVAIAVPDATATAAQGEGTEQAKVLLRGTPCTDANVLTVDTFELTEAGTYYLGNVINSNRIYKLELEVSEAGGDSVDKTALTAAVEAAKTALAAAVVSVDGTDVATDKTWITAADKATLEAAIAAAENLAADATQADVDAAKAAVEAAAGAIKAGLKDEGGNTALADAIKAAQKLVDETYESEDGTDVSTRNEWVTKAVMDALKAAIAEAKKVGADATEEEIEAAKEALADAVKDFEDAKKPGSKRSVGGGSTTTVTSNVTTKNETLSDGTKRTTETNAKDGTVKVTDTMPDGTKAVTTTTADGAVTTEVTLGRDSESAQVSVPVDNANSGMVAVLVKDDGTEEIIRDSAVVNGSVVFDVTGNAKVKIVNKAKRFVDVSGHWAESNVDFVSARELFNGVDSTHFAPDTAMTRGMMATVLYRLDGETKAKKTADFTDVASGQWYTDAVDWASEVGVVNGYGDGTFVPLKSISREELAVMVYRYAKSLGLGYAEGEKMANLTYVDAGQVSDWAAEAISWLTAKGVLNGKPGNIIDAKGLATRAEVSAVLERFVKLTK